MHTIDWLILIPFAYFVIRGFTKGLIIEVFTILALICGLIGSMKFTNQLLPYIDFLHNDSTLLVYLFYLAVFLLIFLLVHLLGKAIEQVMKATALNIFNRIAGAALGFLKAALMISIIYWLSEQGHFLSEHFKSTSVSYDLLANLAPGIIGFLTDQMPYFRELINEAEIYFEQLLKQVESKQKS